MTAALECHPYISDGNSNSLKLDVLALCRSRSRPMTTRYGIRCRKLESVIQINARFTVGRVGRHLVRTTMPVRKGTDSERAERWL
jgi:hypothetical protein